MNRQVCVGPGQIPQCWFSHDAAQMLFLSIQTIQICFMTSHNENMSVKCITLISHFYIAKLGYAGVHLFVLFLLQNIDCGMF